LEIITGTARASTVRLVTFGAGGLAAPADPPSGRVCPCPVTSVSALATGSDALAKPQKARNQPNRHHDDRT
jgi:hypothetical protein